MLIMQSQRGFTLIELMITLVIVAILVGLALPSFKIVMANAQIRTGAQALNDGLQLARVEAIRLNERVIFTLGTKTAWTVSRETSGDTVQTRPYNDGSTAATVAVTPSTSTQVTFNSLGRVVTNSNGTGSITQIDVDVPTTIISAANSKELRITITTGGAIRLCDPNMATGVGMGC